MLDGEQYRQLDEVEDPGGKAARISSRWAVAHKLDIGRRNADGRLTRLPFFGIRRGDFVDATGFVDRCMRAHLRCYHPLLI